MHWIAIMFPNGVHHTNSPVLCIPLHNKMAFEGYSNMDILAQEDPTAHLAELGRLNSDR